MLKGKIALVTGGSRGIGSQIARSLAAEGAVVIVNYNGSKEKAEEVLAAIKEAGGEGECLQFHVGDEESCNEGISSIIKKYGRLDILVNNAGITRDGLLMKMSGADFTDVLDVNLKGAFFCLKAVSRQMLKQRAGRVINISSVVGIAGNAGQANYAASKAGMIGLTKSAAKELASRGITVNAIAPGFIETEMTQGLSETVREGAINQIPLKRFGSSEDVANMAVYLASEKAGYITGQVIQVDGGMVM